MRSTLDSLDPICVSVDGVDIATYVLGPAGGDPLADVVFCHGTPWSSHVWAQTARHLSRRYRVHLWDMPGYGRSPKDPAVPVDLDSQMSRFAQLLGFWRLASPYVIAHDIGGAVALGAHLLYGSAYAGVSLWDTVALEPWGSPFFRLVADHAEVFAQLPAALHSALVREYIAGAAFNPLSLRWVEALTSPWLGELGQPAFYRQIAALRPEHTRPVVELLPEVRCPVAIGWGTEDPWIPVEQAAQLQDRLPGTPPITALDQVGHLAPVEASSRVVRALSDWLAQSRRSRSESAATG